MYLPLESRATLFYTDVTIIMDNPQKRRGRPTKPPVEGTRVMLGLRVTANIKRKLEAAAIESGRSLSQEAEFRLEQSFERVDFEALQEDLAGRIAKKVDVRWEKFDWEKLEGMWRHILDEVRNKPSEPERNIPRAPNRTKHRER